MLFRNNTLIALLGMVFAVAANTAAVELLRFTPDTYAEYVPMGKEVDAIHGDFLLRNNRLAVVIADNSIYRSANVMTLGIGGGVIDLTTRDHQSDQMAALLAWPPFSLVLSEGIEVDGRLMAETCADAQVLHGQEAAIRFQALNDPKQVVGQGEGAVITVAYRLRDDEPFLRMEVTYTNPTSNAVPCRMVDMLRMDQSYDGKALVRGQEGPVPCYWVYTPYSDQAYAILPKRGGMVAKTQPGFDGATDAVTVLAYPDGAENPEITLAPGESRSLTRLIIPARTAAEALSLARDLSGVEQRPVRIHVTDENGIAINAAKVTFADPALGWGRTDERGVLALELPLGAHAITVSSLGHGEQSVSLAPGTREATVTFPVAGQVVARVVDADGGPIPCKVQVIGKEGTETPFFGPDSGAEAVHNLRYTPNGRFEQALAPGSYDIIISRGPEYDAVFTEITIQQGQVTPLKAQLHRVVDSTGWISGDFHSHSSSSGDNITSQRGRILNILCEHVEFAPSTEHNRIDSYRANLQAYGVSDLLVTCPGIELTSMPGNLNHHNAWPLRMETGAQDAGAPMPALEPAVQIARLATWDDDSEKVTQQNHPDLREIFFDQDKDGKEDGGIAAMPEYMDVIEIHPLHGFFAPPLVEDIPGLKTETTYRIATWLTLWNLGRGVPGIANTDTHTALHGSSDVRTYVKSDTDTLAQVEIPVLNRAIKEGRMLLTNGPFLELDVANAKGATATVGDTLVSGGDKVTVSLRVQCPNWFDIDRVDLLVNGQRSHSFTRASHPDFFSDAVVRFEHTVELELDSDAHIIAGTIGTTSTLGPVAGPKHGKNHPVAFTNPVFIDSAGDGFQPNGDSLGIALDRYDH